MTDAKIFQQVPHSRGVALGVIDGLARALRTAGSVPPPLGEIRCEIVEQTLPVPRTFDPPRILWTFRNATGFLILDGTYSHEHAPAFRRPLGDGAYRIRIAGTYYEDQEFTLQWPPPEGVARLPLNQPGKPDNIELLPGAAYPLPDVTAARLQLGPTIFRGSLYTASGDPIRDVSVEIVNLPPFLAPAELPPLALGDWPFVRTNSNARGDWALVLPSRRYLDAAPEIPPGPNPPPIVRPFTIRIHYAGGPFDLLQPNVELGREHSVKNTALRGQVTGRGGRPIAGAQIATSVNASTSVSRANGVWFLYFDLDQPDVNNVTVTVTTPDGATASNAAVSVLNRATVVVPTFHFS